MKFFLATTFSFVSIFSLLALMRHKNDLKPQYENSPIVVTETENHNYLCHLLDLPLENLSEENTIREDRKHFSTDKEVTIFSLVLENNSQKNPHWHPTGDELAYCIQGHAKVGTVNSSGYKQAVNIQAGDIVRVPKTDFHFIENLENEELKMLIIFNHKNLNDTPITWK